MSMVQGVSVVPGLLVDPKGRKQKQMKLGFGICICSFINKVHEVERSVVQICEMCNISSCFLGFLLLSKDSKHHKKNKGSVWFSLYRVLKGSINMYT